MSSRHRRRSTAVKEGKRGNVGVACMNEYTRFRHKNVFQEVVRA